MLRVSGKTGQGVAELLDRVVRDIPPPVGDADAPTRAMIFDSVYDTYRGVITYVRVIDGALKPREKIAMMSTLATHDLLEIGVISPEPTPTKGLRVGEVGYLITGVKDVRQSKVGDTVTLASNRAKQSLAGYRDPRPMVYSGLFPLDGSDFPILRDASTSFSSTTPRSCTSPRVRWRSALGSAAATWGSCTLRLCATGWSASSIIELISTAPNVVYEVEMEDGKVHTVTNPSEFPAGKIHEVREPMVKASILVPSEFIGTVMELCQERRGVMGTMNYLSELRVEMHYTLPLAEVVFDFFDQLKSRTRGYGSLGLRARRRAGRRTW